MPRSKHSFNILILLAVLTLVYPGTYDEFQVKQEEDPPEQLEQQYNYLLAHEKPSLEDQAKAKEKHDKIQEEERQKREAEEAAQREIQRQAQAKREIATLPSHELDGLLQQYFGTNWKKAKAVAQCESGLRPSAHNYNPSTGDNSYGLFQINLYGNLAKSRPPGDWLLVAENNVSYAAQMSGGGANFGPWTCARKLGIV